LRDLAIRTAAILALLGGMAGAPVRAQAAPDFRARSLAVTFAPSGYTICAMKVSR